MLCHIVKFAIAFNILKCQKAGELLGYVKYLLCNCKMLAIIIPSFNGEDLWRVF